MIKPIALLKLELNSHKKALKKSRLSRFTGNISHELHRQHYNNLMPMIKEYESAIKKLKS